MVSVFRVPHTFTTLAQAFPARVSQNFQEVQRWLRRTSEGTAVAKTASQTVSTSTNTALSFVSGGVRWDDAGWWDAATPTRFTFAEDMRVKFGGEIQFSGNALGCRYVWVRLNGTTRIASFRCAPCGASLATLIQVAGRYEFSAGDYIELIAWQDSGTALTAQASSTTHAFWAERIK